MMYSLRSNSVVSLKYLLALKPYLIRSRGILVLKFGQMEKDPLVLLSHQGLGVEV
jgi:hypothetical protein